MQKFADLRIIFNYIPHFSDMTINYVEVFNDQNRCDALISASDFPHEKETDPLSPESCVNRCHSNASKNEWTEGFCTCNGGHHDCGDFLELCGTFIDNPPKFFKSIGLTSWLQVSVACVSGIVLLILTTCFFVWIIRKRSTSSIMERTKRSTMELNEHSDVRYMVNGFEDDEMEFINFDLATPTPNIVQDEPLIEHQYAALEESDGSHHRYEVPPGEESDIDFNFED